MGNPSPRRRVPPRSGEGEDDTEGFVEKSAERSVAAEQRQQQVPGHDRRHHERQVNHAVEQALAVNRPRARTIAVASPRGKLPTIAQNAMRRLSPPPQFRPR
jgi:hypothetical protein